MGCQDNGKDNNITKEEISSADFILKTLEKKSDANSSNDISVIKKSLNTSLKEITEEESRKSRLKKSLIALVERVDETKAQKSKNIRNFVDSIEDSDLGVASSSKKITSIKDKLASIVNLEESNIKPKEVKKRLQSLITDVTESKNTLSQTQKSLKKLVENAEEKNTPSAKQFASAIIKDVSAKKITILKESKKYFTIRVKHGDNLSILAKRYYNNTNKFKLIYNANRGKINSKYEIFPGTKLLIPKI
jgi:nucleoid-associated protein YgaU